MGGGGGLGPQLNIVFYVPFDCVYIWDWVKGRGYKCDNGFKSLREGWSVIYVGSFLICNTLLSFNLCMKGTL